MTTSNASMLTEFTGTERYYRISRRHLLTDGTKYLAEQAECFWMMDAIASHLMKIGTADWFVVVRIKVENSTALMVYEDGNGQEQKPLANPANVCVELNEAASSIQLLVELVKALQILHQCLQSWRVLFVRYQQSNAID